MGKEVRFFWGGGERERGKRGKRRERDLGQPREG